MESTPQPVPPRTKSEWRAHMRAALARISPDVNTVESMALCDRLRPQLGGAGGILFFAPQGAEPDIWPLLAATLAKRTCVALPWFNPATQTYQARQVRNLAEDIVIGQYGIREPAAQCPEIPLETLHLVLVPGLAFDHAGRRLGRGKGYYDRLLAEISGVKCGVCHDLQLIESLPAEPHDQTVNFIITPDRCLRARRAEG